VLPGYPVEPRKFTLEEIRAYFSGDRIVCLRCGKPYGSLGVHLKAIHGLSDDEYREMYGLPWRRGLTGTEANRNISQTIVARIEAGWKPPSTFQLGNQAIKERGFRIQPFRAEQSLKNIANRLPRGSPYPDNIFDQMILRVADGRTINEVCQDADMPGRSWFHAHCKANPEDRERLMVLLDTMPFDFQARNQMGFGPRFWSEVERLRQRGLSDHQIADQAGLTAMTINRRRRERGIA